MVPLSEGGTVGEGVGPTDNSSAEDEWNPSTIAIIVG